MTEVQNYAELARQTIVTGEHSQVVVMTLQPGEDIGEETHEGDQILFFIEGRGEAVLEGEASPVGPNDMVFVPAGTLHNLINKGDDKLRLVTTYAPPEHPDGTVHETKAEAEAAEH